MKKLLIPLFLSSLFLITFCENSKNLSDIAKEGIGTNPSVDLDAEKGINPKNGSEPTDLTGEGTISGGGSGSENNISTDSSEDISDSDIPGDCLSGNLISYSSIMFD